MRISGWIGGLLPLLLLFGNALAGEGGTITVQLPKDVAVKSATAVAAGLKVETTGEIQGTAISFEKLLPEISYDIRLVLENGTTIQGVNLEWYNEEEAKPDVGPMTDADRDEILKISSIDPFYSVHEIIATNGNHDRAAALVRLVRDKDFYAGAGQVIWRIEIYYFKNQHGGWEKISQQNKIVRRERFKTIDAYKASTAKLKFAPIFGGIRLDKDQTAKTIKVDNLEGDSK